MNKTNSNFSFLPPTHEIDFTNLNSMKLIRLCVSFNYVHSACCCRRSDGACFTVVLISELEINFHSHCTSSFGRQPHTSHTHRLNKPNNLWPKNLLLPKPNAVFKFIWTVVNWPTFRSPVDGRPSTRATSSVDACVMDSIYVCEQKAKNIPNVCWAQSTQGDSWKQRLTGHR